MDDFPYCRFFDSAKTVLRQVFDIVKTTVDNDEGFFDVFSHCEARNGQPMTGIIHPYWLI